MTSSEVPIVYSSCIKLNDRSHHTHLVSLSQTIVERQTEQAIAHVLSHRAAAMASVRVLHVLSTRVILQKNQ